MFLKDKILTRPFSTIPGNERKRSVCPVGAVSNTTTENSILRTSLMGDGVGQRLKNSESIGLGSGQGSSDE